MKIKVILASVFFLALCFCLGAIVYTKSGEYALKKQQEELLEKARIEQEAKRSKVETILNMKDFPTKELILSSLDTFISDLEFVLSNEAETLILVDKPHPLPDGYIPANLVKLDGKNPLDGSAASYLINRNDLSLTSGTEKALEIMAAESKKEGITLVVSSTYRSYEYQKTIYERNVRLYGQEVTDRESARPGHSQHQLGTAIDFGSITDDFEFTKAGQWLFANAKKYGFSLSFPKGMEPVTGYRYECWHYRYIGTDACKFQEKWFNDIQQYMIEFINYWRTLK